MGICWYCYWGWPEPIADIYKKALRKLNGANDVLHYGPAHIVWEDESFGSAKWCLENFKKGDLSERELDVVRWSLQELIKLPANILNTCPDDYDDEHPELYPPPNGMKMVQISWV